MLTNRIIALLLKCINGDIKCIEERKHLWVEFFDQTTNLLTVPEYKEAVKLFDNHPMLKGDDHPTNTTNWNKWYYIGSKHNDQG